MTNRVLVVDDDASVRAALAQTLDLADFEAVTAGSFVEAKDHILPSFDGIVVSDIRMPGRDGFHLLDHARDVDPDLPVILLTGEGDIPMAVQAMANGAFGFLEKPCGPAELTAVIQSALKTRHLVLENRRLISQLEKGDPASRLIFGVSAQSDVLRAQVRAAGRAQTGVLVTGAQGTGIAKVAEVVQLTSVRAKSAFEKRAAAGLDRPALLQLWQTCRDGTVFLDEVHALPQDAQVALVDLLEDRSVMVIGGTTQNLEQSVALGQFSSDLYYRLNVFEIRIPSLAERPQDIPVLFRHYVAQAAEQAGLTPPPITEDVISDLIARAWPGNARALMSHAMRFALGLGQEAPQGSDLGLVERLAQVERSLLIEALRKADGQARLASAALKLPRKTFYDKLAKYGIKPDAFRSTDP